VFEWSNTYPDTPFIIELDQITEIAWKVMLPLALINIVLTAIIAPLIWR